MLTLDPLKLLLIVVVGLVVLGPEQLPKAARRAGSLLSDLRRLRTSLHEQATQTFGDHPLVTELTNARRTITQTLVDVDPRGAVSRLGSNATPGAGDPLSAAAFSPLASSTGTQRSSPDPDTQDRPGRPAVVSTPAATDPSLN